MKHKSKKTPLILGSSILLTTILYQSSKQAKRIVTRQKPIKSADQIKCYSEAKVIKTTNHQNKELNGYYFDNNSTLTVLINHPYNSTCESMECYVRFFQTQFQCNVLVVDALCHGTSEGDTHQLGGQDDILCWIKYLIPNSKKIILFGKEMGANSILNNIDNLQQFEQIKAIISDGAYTNIKDFIHCYLKKNTILPFIKSKRLINWIISSKYKININKLNTIFNVSKNTIPTIYVHSKSDHFVPLNNVFQLYNANYGKKELFVLQEDLMLHDIFRNENEYLDTYENHMLTL